MMQSRDRERKPVPDSLMDAMPSVKRRQCRPGILLSVICLPEDADRLAKIMMKHTTTLGIRRQDMSRYVLQRAVETVKTPYGPVRMKKASGMGIVRRKAEYEDLAALAQENKVSLEEVRRLCNAQAECREEDKE